VSARQQKLAQARLYLVCDARPDAFLHSALEGGVDLVQLRCKDADDDEVLRAAERFKAICAEHDALFVVNDRPDLALKADADGVHVGQDDAPVDAAREQPVDYIAVGPVHETPTKPGRPAVGLELVSYAAAHATVPFFAIGGIDPGNADAVAAAGAERIVVVRALTQAPDPRDAAQRLRAAVTRARQQVGSAQS
jgi:thiamine-phosphate pyrophosphorylase